MRSRATYRGFESHPVRHFLFPFSDSLQPSLVLGCVVGFNLVLLISFFLYLDLLVGCFGVGVVLVGEVGEVESFFSCESFHEE